VIRDHVYTPPAIYTTYDAGGRPRVCPAAARMAADAEFAERVRVLGEARKLRAIVARDDAVRYGDGEHSKVTR
jgi:hypothetical protein